MVSFVRNFVGVISAGFIVGLVVLATGGSRPLALITAFMTSVFSPVLVCLFKDMRG